MPTLQEVKAEAATLLGKSDLSADDVARLDALSGQFEALSKAAAAFAGASEALNGAAPGDGEPVAAKSLGEHFVKSVGLDGLAGLRERGTSVSAPEFVKAATDPQLTPGAFAPLLTTVDPNVETGLRRPSVLDLFGSGDVSGNSVTYFVEGPFEGGFTAVPDDGATAKSQFHVGDPSPVTDTLTTIAGWFDVHESMVEDAAFWVSEINNRGLYELELANEWQVLRGDGAGANLTGVLNRPGVQSLAQGTDTVADAVFRATTRVLNATGLAADGILIHPTDYEKLRLSKDANGQYYGGGFFSGAYGNGGMPAVPPLWGYPTRVSPAIPEGTVVVGALKAAATVYSKGGVKVAVTNSDGTKFRTNVRTTRIENRKALAVRKPLAVVKVNLGV